MEEVETKHKFDKNEQLQCRICLSIGRRLVPLGRYGVIYRKLFSDVFCQVSLLLSSVPGLPLVLL